MKPLNAKVPKSAIKKITDLIREAAGVIAIIIVDDIIPISGGELGDGELPEELRPPIDEEPPSGSNTGNDISDVPNDGSTSDEKDTNSSGTSNSEQDSINDHTNDKRLGL